MEELVEGCCPVTGRDDMIDDCYITVEFGYGSDKDMMTYNMGPVHDIVGKKVLELIQGLMDASPSPEGKSVEDFGKDTLADGMNLDWWKNLSVEEKEKYKKEWGI